MYDYWTIKSQVGSTKKHVFDAHPTPEPNTKKDGSHITSQSIIVVKDHNRSPTIVVGHMSETKH